MQVLEKKQSASTLDSAIQEIMGYIGMRVVKVEEGKLLGKGPLLQPGEVLRDVLDRIGMSSEDACEKAGISFADLRAIFNGEAQIDESLRNKLNLLRDGTGETLFQYQKTYNYYMEHGRLPF